MKTSQLLINTQDVIGPWNMQYTSRTSQRPKPLQPGLEFKASIIPRRYNGQYGDPQPVGGQRSNRSTPDYSSFLCEKQSSFRRRPFLSVEARQQTAQTRKDKACIRCRMQKVRVLNSSFCNLSYYKLLIVTLVYSGSFKSTGNLFDLPESHKF